MIDVAVLTALVETTLHDVVKLASSLATGLQNASPGNKENTPNKSVLYLMQISAHLAAATQHVSEDALLVVRQAVAEDRALREQHQIGDKFRFIRDRLLGLLLQLEAAMNEVVATQESIRQAMQEDEMLVYIYLFNAEGKTLSMWHKLVTPAILYEHSVNRPIYGNKTHIDSVLKKKTNPTQHAYLTVRIKKADVLSDADAGQDALGHPLLKVKEGSLRFEQLIAFTHVGIEYVADEHGVLVRKTT